jgi:hypothetical protein
MRVLIRISFYLMLLGTSIFYRHVFVFKRNEHSCSYDRQTGFTVPSRIGNLKWVFTVDRKLKFNITVLTKKTSRRDEMGCRELQAAENGCLKHVNLEISVHVI